MYSNAAGEDRIAAPPPDRGRSPASTRVLTTGPPSVVSGGRNWDGLLLT